MNKLRTTEEYQGLVEELQAALVEGWKTWEEFKVRALHGVGEIISTNPLYRKNHKGNLEFLMTLAKDIKGKSEMPVSKSRLYECIQIYQKYPDVSTLLEKLESRPSWHHALKLINPPKDEKKKDVCKHCKIHCKT